MDNRNPELTPKFPSKPQLLQALSLIGSELEKQPLKSSSLARIMREIFGGSDALAGPDGAIPWPAAGDGFALDGITSFSAAPLKMATGLGLLTSSASFLYGAFMLVRTLLYGNPVPGYPSLIIVVLFLGGVQLICLGIIGEYLARTYQESKGRALYVLKGYHPAADPGLVRQR